MEKAEFLEFIHKIMFRIQIKTGKNNQSSNKSCKMAKNGLEYIQLTFCYKMLIIRISKQANVPHTVSRKTNAINPTTVPTQRK